jgi:hypothetical protein
MECGVVLGSISFPQAASSTPQFRSAARRPFSQFTADGDSSILSLPALQSGSFAILIRHRVKHAPKTSMHSGSSNRRCPCRLRTNNLRKTTATSDRSKQAPLRVCCPGCARLRSCGKSGAVSRLQQIPPLRHGAVLCRSSSPVFVNLLCTCIMPKQELDHCHQAPFTQFPSPRPP